MANKSCVLGLSLVVLFAAGCSGPNRFLLIKSEPPDAEVCIKGKARSERFPNAKNCVGTTPYEADHVTVVNPDGAKEVVKFKDIANDKESFYVLVSQKGYVPQVVEVPEWAHTVTLKPEMPAVIASNLPVASIPAEAQRPAEKGVAKITSEPSGALVYIGDQLKGNTPFTYEGPTGIVRLKLEMEGYKTVEKPLSVESGGQPLSLNFKMLPEPHTTHK